MKNFIILYLVFAFALGSYSQTTATLQSKPTATSPAGDDWLLLQGATNGQRKLSPNYYQPFDTDLTSIAALSTTAFGRSFLSLADAAAARTLIGAGTSSFSGTLSGLGQSGATTNQVPQWNGSEWVPVTLSSGAGDMLRSVYDVNADGIIDVGSLPTSYASLLIGTLSFTTWGGGTVPDANVASTIARDSEVTAAVAAEATARGTAITDAIAQEVTDRNTAIAAAVGGVSAGSLPVGLYAELPTGVTPPATFLLTDGNNGTPTRTAASGFTGYVQGGGTLAATTVDVAAGTYTAAQSVTISGTAGSTIRYTTDGQDPTRSVGSTYSTPVSIAASSTLKHRQVRDFYGDGPVTSTAYTINLPAAGFSWAMESLTATGSGDTSATLTGATLSSAWAQAGTQSLYCSGAAWQYAEFTTGGTANPDLNLQEGTMSFYIRWTGTWAASPFLASLQANSGSARIAVIAQATQGQIQLAYRGSNNSSTTLLATGLTNPDTWYLVTVKWRQTSSPYLSIQFDNGTATTSPNVLASVAEASAKILVGNYSATGSSTAFYIDNLTVSTTWQ